MIAFLQAIVAHFERFQQFFIGMNAIASGPHMVSTGHPNVSKGSWIDSRLPKFLFLPAKDGQRLSFILFLALRLYPLRGSFVAQHQDSYTTSNASRSVRHCPAVHDFAVFGCRLLTYSLPGVRKPLCVSGLDLV